MTTDTSKAMIKAIGPLFIPGAFPRQEQEGTEKQLLDVYLIAVEGIPVGFVAMACKRFIQGQVVGCSVTFRPTPAEFAVEARRLRDKALEAQRFDGVLLPKPPSNDPPDPTPEERQRCAETWIRARREIEAAVDATRMPRKGLHAPAPDYTPKVDVSDLPDANASRAEVKAWEERQKGLWEQREGRHADGG